MSSRLQVLVGDARERLRELPDASVNCCVTSPPYFGLRDYGVSGQLGLEKTPEAFVEGLVSVFREVRRVLRDEGTLWLNLGDSYGKDKNRLMIPATVALALRADGWFLRDEVVWHKPRTTPAPLKDRTVPAHEMLYLLTKSPRYYYDYLVIEEPSKYPGEKRQKGKVFRKLTDGRAGTKNAGQTFAEDRVFVTRDTRRKRSVWSISPSPYKQAHFATFPPDLIEPCVMAGCPAGGIVLDPFGGSGTTAGVALKHGRKAVLIELNPVYAELVPSRVASIAGEGWDLL